MQEVESNAALFDEVGSAIGDVLFGAKRALYDCVAQTPMVPRLDGPEDLAHAYRLSNHVYNVDAYTGIAPPGYVTLRASDVETGMWIGHPVEDRNNIWVSVRGSRVAAEHFVADWAKANTQLAWGDMFSSGRLLACHEFYYSCKDLFQPESKLHLTGHSLGGTLALELLRNSMCNATFASYDPRCIVFNPGYVFEQRHYRFLNYDFWARVTVLRMCADAVSHGMLRSKFQDNKRVWTLIRENPESYNPIDPHFMLSFNEFAEFHYNDELRSAGAAQAKAKESEARVRPATPEQELEDAIAEIDRLILLWETKLATTRGPVARKWIRELRIARNQLTRRPEEVGSVRRKLAKLKQAFDADGRYVSTLAKKPRRRLYGGAKGAFVDLCLA